MIEWLEGQPWWLQVVLVLLALDMLCLVYFLKLCLTAPREEEVFGRRDVDI